MLAAVDLVLSGEGLGLETALDLFREIWHSYPELSAHWDECELQMIACIGWGR